MQKHLIKAISEIQASLMDNIAAKECTTVKNLKAASLIACLIAVMLSAASCDKSSAVSCGKPAIGPCREVTVYGKETVKTEIMPELIMKIQSGDIDVFTHASEDIVFETAMRAAGDAERDDLMNALLKVSYNVECNNSKTVFTFPGANSDVKPQYDLRLGITVYVPKKIKNISIQIDRGNITFHDDLKCDIAVKAGAAGIGINNPDGRIDIEGKIGNVRISSGKLKEGSQIKMDAGNLHIAVKEYQQGSYFFKTGKGDISVYIPEDSIVTFENVGIVRENEHTYSSKHSYSDPATKISLLCDLGEISIKKNRSFHVLSQ